VDIQGKRALVLGGYGLVGMAVCRRLLEERPESLVIASLRQDQADQSVRQLRQEVPDSPTRLISTWGDLLLRAEWQEAAGGHPRDRVLDDRAMRRRLVADILEELNDEILQSSFLYQVITGQASDLEGKPADIIIDCVNTATAMAYQNIYRTAGRLQEVIEHDLPVDWHEEVERLLASLYIPQLVRHLQILYEAMLQAGTQAYVKVGTSGTGGMGFNIPYTHGEEKPSRVLLSKSAMAGAQTMLTFLLARTPGGPQVVKEIKPTAAIGWKEIGFGPIRSGGRTFALFDCDPDAGYPLDNPATLSPMGDFGRATGEVLESVYIHTGENGLFATGEFTAITTLGQMEFVTPEEIAANVVAEIKGGNTGRDVIAALDGSVMGPSYRAGLMRQAALARLRQLEDEHGRESVAFELLGPPRLSKLLFEAYLIKRVAGGIAAALKMSADELSQAMFQLIRTEAVLRRHILSIGIPILLPSGSRLLRGPQIKSSGAHQGWVDLTPDNCRRWLQRLADLQVDLRSVLQGDSSSRRDRAYPSLLAWRDEDRIEVGDIAGWIFIHEEHGRRGKS
jgi:NAD(P)-dependent dehydrogenase (short-subunit alcohol dehydrogenase family)